MRTVLFDLDGTLVDSLPLIFESFRHILDAHWPDIDHDYDKILGYVGKPLEELMLEITSDPDHADQLVNEYRSHNRAILKQVKLFDRIKEALNELKADDFMLGIVTSKNNVSTDITLDAVELDGLFEVVISKEDTSRHKPNPEPLLLALEKIGTSPENACYVGDSIYDMQSAHNAGCVSVGALWGAHDPKALRAEEPRICLNHIDELRPFLENLRS